MALGPFARVITQVVLTAGGVVGRAVGNARKEAAARGAANPTGLSHAISRRMSPEEASKILEVDIKTLTMERLMERSTHMKKINQPVDDFLGSPYIQRRVENAQTVLSETLPRNNSS